MGLISKREALLNRAIQLHCAVQKYTPEQLGEIAFKIYEQTDFPIEEFEDELINYYS